MPADAPGVLIAEDDVLLREGLARLLADEGFDVIDQAGNASALLALAHRHYGYRRISSLLGREGWQVNHKRVLRLMRGDNLLCLRRKAAFVPATTDSRHAWRVVPNLARGMIASGLDQLWVADITYVHLAEEFAYLAILLDGLTHPDPAPLPAQPIDRDTLKQAMDQARSR